MTGVCRGGNLPFLDAIWAVAPTAIRMGLRSEIGLAVTKFPPMDWGERERRWEWSLGGAECGWQPRLCTHCHVPDLVPSKPPQHLKYCCKCLCLVLCEGMGATRTDHTKLAC